MEVAAIITVMILVYAAPALYLRVNRHRQPASATRVPNIGVLVRHARLWSRRRVAVLRHERVNQKVICEMNCWLNAEDSDTAAEHKCEYKRAVNERQCTKRDLISLGLAEEI